VGIVAAGRHLEVPAVHVGGQVWAVFFDVMRHCIPQVHADQVNEYIRLLDGVCKESAWFGLFQRFSQ